MANEYAVNRADLTAVADAIRTKGGTADALAFPDGFVSAVQAIQAAGKANLDDVDCAIIDYMYDVGNITIFDGTLYETRRLIVS